MNESKIQAQCHTWAWNTYPALRRYFFAIPNSANRSFIEGAQMKATGTVAGVPDYILLDGQTYQLIEFKTLNGKLSPAQKEFQEIHFEKVAIVRDFENFKEIFKKFFHLI